MSIKISRSALLPYPAQDLYELVNDVERYPEFLPWCSKTKLISSSAEQLTAELTASKAGISYSFTTTNQMIPGQQIIIQLESGPFKRLHGVWQFTALSEQAGKMSLELEFEYSAMLVQATLGPIFNHAANTMVDAFCQRAKQIYG